MRGLPGSFVARRMRSSWLLLAGVAVTVLITATLTAALASFGSAGLPLAVHQQLDRSPAVSIAISGQVNAATAVAGTRAVRTSMRHVLRDVPYQLDRALWSDPLGLPAPRGSRTVPLAEAAAGGRIEANATLVAGTWPGRPVPGGPVGAALPVTAAGQLRLAPGAVLVLRDRDTGRRIRVRITGLFALHDPAARYWGIDLVGRSGVSVQPPYVTYGPLVVSPAAFGPGGLAVGGVSWVVLPDSARLSGASLPALAGRIGAAESYLQNASQFGGLQVSTGLPGLLAGLGRNLVVARSLLALGIVQLLLLAAAALWLASRLLASHRDEESALLAARGAARWQLARPAAAEAAVLGVLAAAAGALLGWWLARLLMTASGLPAAGGPAGGLAVPASAWWAAAAVLALSTAILLWPSLQPPAPGVASARQGRPALVARIAQAGGDIALLALAVIAVWELRSYSAVAHPGAGGLGIDPVPVLAPALALAGLTLVPLRLLPALARAIDGLIGRTRRLGAALAGWEISRRPVRQSGPVLLVILAVGTGSLAIAQYQSWHRSVQDQASFTAGADVRVDTLTPLPLASSGVIARAPGVIAAMPVAAGVTGAGGQIIGLDARQAAATVLLRPDLSPLPAPRLWRLIIPSRRAPGPALPGRPGWLRITASLAPGAAGNLGTAAATVAIQDAGGAVYTVPAGLLPADGRPHPLLAVLSPARRAAYPLRLLGLSLTYTMPPFTGAARAARIAAHPASLVIHTLAAGPAGSRGAPGAPAGRPAGTVFAGGSALASWRPAISSPELGIIPPPLPGGPPAGGSSPAVRAWQAAPAGGRRLTFQPGQAPSASTLAFAGVSQAAVAGVLTLTAPAPARVIPGIATQAFLRQSHASTGAIVPVTVSGMSIPVRIVAAVSQFPTVSGGALIVDQTALQDLLASQWQPPLPVGQWWLRTAAGSAPAGLPRGATVTARSQELAAGLGNRLSAVPEQAALAIAVAAALLAVVGFSVSVMASVRDRRVQNAVLAALGVDRAGQAGQLCLEQLLLSLPAAAAGLLAGAVLARLLIPAVTLTAAATAPVPPVLIEFSWRWSVGLALAIAVIPVAVAAATIAYRPDPAARLRAAQAA